MSYDLSELDQYVNRLQRLARDGIAGPIIEGAADVWVAEAKRTAPIDTGQLQARIGIEQLDLRGSRASATIVSDVPYASFVNFGTRFQPPKPYFDRGEQAARKALAGVGRRLEASIELALESGGVINPRSLFR